MIIGYLIETFVWGSTIDISSNKGWYYSDKWWNQVSSEYSDIFKSDLGIPIHDETALRRRGPSRSQTQSQEEEVDNSSKFQLSQ